MSPRTDSGGSPSKTPFSYPATGPDSTDAVSAAQGWLPAFSYREANPGRLRPTEQQRKTRHLSPLRSIVIGTDGSPSAEAAVRRGAEVARGSGARVHLVTVYPDIPSYRETIRSSAKAEAIDLREVADGVLARAARELEAEGVEVETHAREGDPADVIIQVAEETDAELIVVGSRGLTGLQRFLLGSVSSKLSQHAPTSLMVVRDD
jgi:nucleotide-binding universal stress UspA family protein